VTTWLAWDRSAVPHPYRDRFRELAHQVVREQGPLAILGAGW